MPAPRYTSFYARVGKRGGDVLFILLLAPLWLPLLLLALLLGFIDFGPSLIFTQMRPGKGEKLFRLIKLRTMRGFRDGKGNLLPDSERTTRIGRFLRKSSLDELPQLLHVLSGKMSLVGPRPLLPEYLPRYSERQRLRHRVLPGITGLAQVAGRNALDWPTRLELDAQYAERISLGLDLLIIAKTLAGTWRTRGAEGQHPGFFGSDNE